MGLPPGSSAYHSLIVHFDNDTPLLCEDRFVNPEAAPQCLQVDFTTITPTRYLTSVAPLWEAQY